MAPTQSNGSFSTQNTYFHPFLSVSDSLPATEATKPLLITLRINDKSVTFVADTGSAQSLIGKQTFDRIWPNARLTFSPSRMNMWDGSSIRVLGVFTVTVQQDSLAFKDTFWYAKAMVRQFWVDFG